MAAKKTDKRLRFLSFKELDDLLKLPKIQRDDLIISILYETGCTVNELVNIKRSHFCFEKNQLKIKSENARNNEMRSVYISDRLIKKIAAFIEENPKSQFLFYTRQSKSMTTKRICQIVKKCCKMAQIKVSTPQILRYTHIVHAYQKNIPLDSIKRQVGLKRSRAIELFSMLPEMDNQKAYRGFAE